MASIYTLVTVAPVDTEVDRGHDREIDSPGRALASSGDRTRQGSSCDYGPAD